MAGCTKQPLKVANHSVEDMAMDEFRTLLTRRRDLQSVGIIRVLLVKRSDAKQARHTSQTSDHFGT